MLRLLLSLPGGRGATVHLETQPIIIGRAAHADVRLDDPLVSGEHARVELVRGQGVVTDLGSRNGTWLNGARVHEATLREGDELTIGNVAMKVASSEPRSPSSLLRVGLAEVRERALDRGRPDDRRLALLSQLGEELNRLGDRDAILAGARAALELVFEPARAFVLSAAGGDELAVVCAPEVSTRPPSRTIAAEAVRTRSVVLSLDVAEDSRFRKAASVANLAMSSALAAPLLPQRGGTGVLYLFREGSAPFGEQDLRLLGMVASHVAAALDNAALLTELRRANADLERARDELAAWGRDLERKVEERTAEVRAQAAEIAELAREKDELLGVAAHDLRSPLASILMSLEIASEGLGVEDPATLREDLGVAAEAARGATALLTDLLDAKKVEAGRIRCEPSDLDGGELVARATALSAMLARKRGVRFATDVEPGVRVWADPRRLEQALANLVSNAFKFTRPGGAVTVALRTVPDGVEASVRDTGPGIDEEEAKRLFRAWEQGDAGRRAGGSGLGLAIARKLVELHGGRIWVETAPGKGSRFAFVLPPRAPA
jgi:signal transduction histidine kinase